MQTDEEGEGEEEAGSAAAATTTKPPPVPKSLLLHSLSKSTYSEERSLRVHMLKLSGMLHATILLSASSWL